MTFLLERKLYKTNGLSGLDDGVVVSPGLFEAVGEFDGLGAVGTPDEKTSRGCAESTDHPEKIFHCAAPFCCWLRLAWFDAARGLDAARFRGVSWGMGF